MGYPSRDVQKAIGNVCLKLKGEIWTRNRCRNLGIWILTVIEGM